MVSKLSHHEIAVRTETQEVTKEAEADRRPALFAGEDES